MDWCWITRSKRTQFVGVWLLSSALLSFAPARLAADVIYVYDEVGRLRSVIDETGDSATYRYDAVGNLTSIARGSSGGLSISSVAPATGTYGTTVTISGTGFAGAADTLLTFNGVAADIASSTPTKLVARVPAGATTGPVTVTTPAGSARSGTAFTVTASDLAPTAFTAPGTAGTGQTIAVSWTVANQGTATTSGSWSDAVFLSADAVCCVGDTSMARVKANVAIGPGRSYTKTHSVVVPKVPAGQYYLVLKVDADRALAEAEVGNNQRAIPITITVPDLVPTALVAPASATTGQAISVGWTVVNRGASAAGPPWTDALFLAAEPKCCSAATPLLRAIRAVGLGAGAAYSQTKMVTVPDVPAGSYYLVLVIDEVGLAWEGDEANNRRIAPISITAPDLAATALAAPASVQAQEAFTVSWSVGNQGAGVAGGGWKDAVYLSANPVCCNVNAGDIALVTISRTTPLAPGAGYAHTRTVTMPRVPAGGYFLFIDVDTGAAVHEADRANNQRMLPITVTTPDLVVTDLSAPAVARARQSVSVSWTVSNQGTGSAKPPWTDTVHLSSRQTCCEGATLLASTSHTTALAPGGSYAQTRSVAIPNKPAGNYYLILRAAAGALFEADEANNQRVVPLTITP